MKRIKRKRRSSEATEDGMQLSQKAKALRIAKLLKTETLSEKTGKLREIKELKLKK